MIKLLLKMYNMFGEKKNIFIYKRVYYFENMICRFIVDKIYYKIYVFYIIFVLLLLLL